MARRTGLYALLSIVVAVGSFVMSLNGHRVWGLVTGILSIPLGIGGFVMAVSPRVGGGVVSIIGIIIGVMASTIAIMGLIGAILF